MYGGRDPRLVDPGHSCTIHNIFNHETENRDEASVNGNAQWHSHLINVPENKTVKQLLPTMTIIIISSVDETTI